MAVPGNWTLNYDWDCDGGYGSTSMVFNANGTWSSGEGYTGLWVQAAGELLFIFDGGGRTTYGGVMASQSVTGISTTFSGLTGCFYLLQAGAPLAAVAERAEGKAD